MHKIAFIHCGCHKTGSTTFQHILKKNQKNMDYYIPKSFRLKFYPINHAPLAWKIIKDERYNNFNYRLGNLKKEIKNKKKILLSSEDFSLVLSNPKLKKKFEKIFENFKLVYLCFFRYDRSRELSLLNEFRYHYKNIKKLKVLSDLFLLKNKGMVNHSMYKSLEKCFYFTSHKKLIKTFFKGSKGKFFVLRFENKTNIKEFLKQIKIFKKFRYDKRNLNLRKNKKFYNFLKIFIKSKKIFINKDRNYKKIMMLNKIL